MYFKNKTLKELRKLADEDQWAYFFENIESGSESSDMPEELIKKLAQMLSIEIGSHYKDLPKIEYFIKLGFFAHE